MFSSTRQVLADQSPGFEGFSAPREALGKGVPVPQGRIERHSGVPRDEGDVGFIRIIERELSICPPCFFLHDSLVTNSHDGFCGYKEFARV